MTINSNVSIIMSTADHSITVVCKSSQQAFRMNDSSDNYETLAQVYASLRKAKACDRSLVWNNAQDEIVNIFNLKGEDCLTNLFDSLNETNTSASSDDELVEKAISDMLGFFAEFDFVPNFRFLNTLANMAKTKQIAYIRNYFALMDSPYTIDVTEKIKSQEFKGMMDKFNHAKPSSVINSRFKIYYGEAGTGKTTKAQQECGNRCIVCNNSMLPSDLMEDFVFENGAPSFKPSALWQCMTNGLPIVLDEINLLPFDSLRFLQGILDGKKEFTYKGIPVTIADGFQVIGTMNLVVNGSVFNLPAPLVDRCAEIKEFKLSAKQLMSAVK
jgi:hypothetical protein